MERPAGQVGYRQVFTDAIQYTGEPGPMHRHSPVREHASFESGEEQAEQGQPARAEGAAGFGFIGTMFPIVADMQAGEQLAWYQIEGHSGDVQRTVPHRPVHVELVLPERRPVVQLIPVVDLETQLPAGRPHADIQPPEVLLVLLGRFGGSGTVLDQLKPYRAGIAKNAWSAASKAAQLPATGPPHEVSVSWSSGESRVASAAPRRAPSPWARASVTPQPRRTVARAARVRTWSLAMAASR